MEYQVRVVGGIESCYVSLPLSLIERLDSSRPSPLSHVFALELRPSSPSFSSDHHRPWHVGWSGSASSSNAVELSRPFAECIGLPDGINVSVRAIPNVQKATQVTIVPHSEDDWEVIELNAGEAESAMLNQVRIVYEAMRFPLWLHGQTVVTFLVVGTDPEKAVVQLMPETLVAVEPKRRRRYENFSKESHMQSVDGHHLQYVPLRVQDPKKTLIHRSNIASVEIGIELSSIILLHPETGKKYSLDPLQVVKIMPRFPSKVKSNGSGKDGELRRKVSSSVRETIDLMSEHELEYAVVHVLFSNTVAKGHVVLSPSLCFYLQSGLHSWIYVQKWFGDLKKNLPVLSVSPCQFVKVEKNRDPKNSGLEEGGHHLMPKTMLQHHSDANVGKPDWFQYHELASAFPSDLFMNNEDNSVPSSARNIVNGLINVWFMAQLDAIKSISGKEAASVVIGRQTFLRFVMLASGYSGKDQISTLESSDGRRGDEELEDEFLFSLSISDNQLHENLWAFEFPFGRNGEAHGINFDIEDIVLGEPVSFQCAKEEAFGQQFRSTLSDLSWISTAASDATNRLKLLLSLGSDIAHGEVKFPLPGHVLIYGPPGSGKSLLASAVAKFFEECDLLVHIIFVCCSSLASEKFTNIRHKLHSCISDALDHSPCLIVFDDFDSIFASASDSEGSQASPSVMSLAESIIGFMDEHEEKKINSCGLGLVAFLGCVRSLDSIPQSLRSPGRFDFHIQLLSPAASERMGILKHEILKRSLQCSDDILHQIAHKCDGYDAYDLEMLVHRSVHAATSRFLPSHMTVEEGKPHLIADDFMEAMKQFLPLSMRDMAKSAPNTGLVGWEDVGGLANVRSAIQEIIEIPSKFPTIFAKSPLRLRSNVLLYGPPGCGKTYIVGAAAAASSLRFISIKGPELLNKYIGASEQAVRDVFAKAAAAAPCLLFFDEFDSIAPKRGHDNTGVTDRVVNQFLTELDGIEVLTGVFVFAATSRPDLLDAALLRPGRLDRLLFCDFPSPNDRLDILTVLARKLPLADDVDLMSIAHMTEGFSAADLQALLSDAQLSAVQELLDIVDSSNKSPVITNELLKHVTAKARPSVSDSEKKRLYDIYGQFLDSKRSIAAQSRDKKGKRATLA